MFSTKRVQAMEQNLTDETVEIQVSQGTLKGTLVLPETTKPCPVVLIIAGSGPTDRNGNQLYGNLNADYLKMLADGLKQHGIASLRYDKRGVGESRAFFNQQEIDVHFDDFVEDAIACINQLRRDKRFSKVIIAGHSEGALIGTIAAERQPVDGLICIAGIGNTVQDTILRQIHDNNPELYQASADIVKSLNKGIHVEIIKPEVLNLLFRPSVQPFLISEFRYNASTEISRVKAPILLIQGTHDLQVQVADAEALKRANPNAKLVIIDGMNHVLKSVGADIQSNCAAYSNPSLPLAEPLIPAITDFVDHDIN